VALYNKFLAEMARNAELAQRRASDAEMIAKHKAVEEMKKVVFYVTAKVTDFRP